MNEPKKFDLTNINADEYEKLDDLIKVIVERQKGRLAGDLTAHANDHRSSHTNKADA